MERPELEQARLDKRLQTVLGRAKAVAREYYELTGRPLGVTAEIAEYEACRLLDLKLAPVRQPATRTGEDMYETTREALPALPDIDQVAPLPDADRAWFQRYSRRAREAWWARQVRSLAAPRAL